MNATKDAIMQKVNSIAPHWSLTSGMCDAVCDFFISDEGKQLVQRAKEKLIQV